jgi:hypothetical protein
MRIEDWHAHACPTQEETRSGAGTQEREKLCRLTAAEPPTKSPIVF